MSKLKWEKVEESSENPCGAYIERAKVPSGWLVRSFQLTFKQSQSITFVLDRNHEWEYKMLK